MRETIQDVVGAIRPNFLAVLISLLMIMWWLLGDIDPSTLFIVGEDGRVGLDVYISAVFGVIMLIVGGLVASLSALLSPPGPPPEVTEDTLVTLVDKALEARN